MKEKKIEYITYTRAISSVIASLVPCLIHINAEEQSSDPYVSDNYSSVHLIEFSLSHLFAPPWSRKLSLASLNGCR